MINTEKYCAWLAKEMAKFLIAELHCQLLKVHLICLRTCKNPTHDTGTAYWHVWWHVCDELVWITSVVRKRDTLACTSTHVSILTNKHWCRHIHTHGAGGCHQVGHMCYLFTCHRCLRTRRPREHILYNHLQHPSGTAAPRFMHTLIHSCRMFTSQLKGQVRMGDTIVW